MSRLTLNAPVAHLGQLERPGGLELATLTRFDVPAMAALYIVSFDTPQTDENLLEAIDEMRMAFDGAFGQPLDNSFIGAWLDGELVGAIMVVLDPPLDDAPAGPWISDLMVAPQHRSRGIATALIGEAAKRLEQAGYETMGLSVDVHQLAQAARLFDYLNFQQA